VGYISWFQLYESKDPNTKHEEYGISAAIVLQFSEALTEAHPGQYHFVFENFFTSIALLDKLSSMGRQATGTVRKGLIDKAPLESHVALKKEERGTFVYRIDGKDNIFCRWNNKCCHCCRIWCWYRSPVSCQSLFPETEKQDPSSAAKHDQSV